MLRCLEGAPICVIESSRGPKDASKAVSMVLCGIPEEHRGAWRVDNNT
jgi:hypothetical protein